MNGEPLDLARRRRLGELLSTTLNVYRRHLWTVLGTTAPIVLVVNLITGVGLNQITAHYQAHPSGRVVVIQALVTILVLTPLVNASLVRLLLEVEQGRRPRPLPTIQGGLDVFAPALGAMLLYVLAVAAGVVAFVLPGLYIAVTWYLATQAVAVEGRRPLAALQRSAELVRGSWLRVFGFLVVITLLAQFGPALAIGVGADALARAANAQVLVLAGGVLVQTVSLPFVALAVGLLFFDLRAAPATPARAPRA